MIERVSFKAKGISENILCFLVEDIIAKYKEDSKNKMFNEHNFTKYTSYNLYRFLEILENCDGDGFNEMMMGERQIQSLLKNKIFINRSLENAKQHNHGNHALWEPSSQNS